MEKWYLKHPKEKEKNNMNHLIPLSVEHAIDAVSVAIVVGTLTTWLPPIAALLSIIWTTLRILEMWTGKTMAERRKIKRKQK